MILAPYPLGACKQQNQLSRNANASHLKIQRQDLPYTKKMCGVGVNPNAIKPPHSVVAKNTT